MAVFGESYSKFQSRVISPSTVISLQFSIIKPHWGEENIIMNQSIKTGQRNFIKLSEDFASFDVICNIWKNGDPPNVMDSLLGYNHDTVYFMPHQDDSLYIDEAGTSNPADFYIVKMVPFYIRNEPPTLQDKLLITFKSLVPVDPTSIIPP